MSTADDGVLVAAAVVLGAAAAVEEEFGGVGVVGTEVVADVTMADFGGLTAAESVGAGSGYDATTAETEAGVESTTRACVAGMFVCVADCVVCVACSSSSSRALA